MRGGEDLARSDPQSRAWRSEKITSMREIWICQPGSEIGPPRLDLANRDLAEASRASRRSHEMRTARSSCEASQEIPITSCKCQIWLGRMAPRSSCFWLPPGVICSWRGHFSNFLIFPNFPHFSIFSIFLIFLEFATDWRFLGIVPGSSILLHYSAILQSGQQILEYTSRIGETPILLALFRNLLRYSRNIWDSQIFLEYPAKSWILQQNPEYCQGFPNQPD